MKVRRDIASVPLRSAAETWRAITDLVTGDGSIDRGQLDAASSILESLIADETPSAGPIVFKGAGSRVVIYCLYNEDAMEAGLDIDRLSFNPTAGDWRMTAPCEDDDAAWMNETLEDRAPRISMHVAGESRADENDVQASKSFAIDWASVGRS